MAENWTKSRKYFTTPGWGRGVTFDYLPPEAEWRYLLEEGRDEGILEMRLPKPLSLVEAAEFALTAAGVPDGDPREPTVTEDKTHLKVSLYI